MFKIIFVVSSTPSSFIFSFSLSSLPSSSSSSTPCTFTLSSSGLVSSSDVLTFLPSKIFSFSQTSESLEKNFQIIPAVPGNYNITISTSRCFDTVDSDVFSLFIRPRTDPPAAPSITNILFSDDGSAIFVNFNSDSNRLGGKKKIIFINFILSLKLI